MGEQALYFFFNDTATTEIYTLSLHDALPISETSNRDRETPSNVRETPFRVRETTSRDRRRRAPSGRRRSVHGNCRTAYGDHRIVIGRRRQAAWRTDNPVRQIVNPAAWKPRGVLSEERTGLSVLHAAAQTVLTFFAAAGLRRQATCSRAVRVSSGLAVSPHVTCSIQARRTRPP